MNRVHGAAKKLVLGGHTDSANDHFKIDANARKDFRYGSPGDALRKHLRNVRKLLRNRSGSIGEVAAGFTILETWVDTPRLASGASPG